MNRIWYGITILLISCSGGSGHFEPGVKISQLNEKKLSEASALESSVRNAGWLWTLNDSGNEPEVYLVDDQLNIKLTCRLNGIENRDWEDIAIGLGPGSVPYIYVADIGDNDAVYPYKHIYRFEEPRFNEGQKDTVVSCDVMTFKLSNGIKDTESLFIDPTTQNFYVVSKREEPVHVYEIANAFKGDTLEARFVASLPYTRIVAADYDPVFGLLIKNYDHIYCWNNPSGMSVVELLKQTPEEVPYKPEPQGEAITWAPDGSAFFTLSESSKRKMAYLYRYDRKMK